MNIPPPTLEHLNLSSSVYLFAILSINSLLDISMFIFIFLVCMIHWDWHCSALPTMIFPVPRIFLPKGRCLTNIFDGYISTLIFNKSSFNFNTIYLILNVLYNRRVTYISKYEQSITATNQNIKILINIIILSSNSTLVQLFHDVTNKDELFHVSIVQ